MLLEVAKLIFDIQTENHSFNFNGKTDVRFCFALAMYDLYRGSGPEVYFKNGIVKNFAKFTRKTLESLFTGFWTGVFL